MQNFLNYRPPVDKQYSFDFLWIIKKLKRKFPTGLNIQFLRSLCLGEPLTDCELRTSIGYSTIETKEVDRIGYSGKKKPVISNTVKFFCFNNNVSNLYNNSVVEKI
jgi:hypothetical protein